MLDQISKHLQYQQDALNLRAYRQQVLASNLANVDTPNYKAKDFNFRQTLLETQRGQSPTLALSTTSNQHLAPKASTARSGETSLPKLQYRADAQPNLDGNSVNKDQEMAQFSQNSLQYQAAVQFMNSRIRSYMDAIATAGR